MAEHLVGHEGPSDAVSGAVAVPGPSVTRGTILVVVSAAAFATLAIFGKLAADEGLRSNTLLQWRFGLAALALGAIGAFRASIPLRTRALLVGSGFVYTAQTGFYFASLGRITAGTTALLLYLAPAFVVLYSALLGRRPGRLQTIGVVVALGGLAVILGTPSVADASASGLAYGAAAGATLAAYMLLGEVAFGGVPPLSIAAHSMSGAVVGFSVLDVATQGHLDRPTGPTQWAIVAAVVVIPTLISIPLMFAAIQTIGAGPTAVISTAEPAFTLVFAAIVLSEPMRPMQLLGGALILGAAIIAQRSVDQPPTTRFPAGPSDGHPHPGPIELMGGRAVSPPPGDDPRVRGDERSGPGSASGSDHRASFRT